MSSSHARRASWVAPGVEHVPPAPPLPPQRYGQQARYAIGRVLGFGGKTQSSLEQTVEDELPANLPSLPSSNATAVHRTGLEINALSINEAGTHALIAGRQIFKTIRVDGDSCTEDANIRTAIRTYNASVGEHRSANLMPKEAVDIHDVAWARGTTGSYIAAATYNGPIILYDLNRLGIEMARLFDHRRQVHRVTFNPHAGHYMLSASQDGMVRMWDIRDCQRSVTSFTSQRSTPGQTEGIRDVKWSPTNGTEFALGTDGGWIQKWDIQMMRTAKVKIAGHATACSTIDWHPDGKHLLSAGTDKAVRVWNVYSEGRKQKPLHEITVPHPLRNARWRPSFQSFAHGDANVRQCTQVVTSYDKEHPTLHIWDLRRPYLPFRELECYQTAPTDLLWHSQDLLWTVGREGVFTQSDVSYATKTIDKRNAQAFAVSPLGEVAVATQTRRPKPVINTKPQLDEESEKPKRHQHRGTAPHKIRSTLDDTLDDNFLSLEVATRRRRPARLQDTGRSLSETPPSLAELGKGRILALDSKMERFRPVRPRQMAARGVLPGPNSALLAAYFAQKYKLRPYLYPPTVDALLNIHQIFEQNSTQAKMASSHRLAQSWRIVGRMLSKDLRQRAEENRRIRLKHDLVEPRNHQAREEILATIKGLVANGVVRASNPPTPLVLPARRLQDLQTPSRASSSGMTTPQAIPRDSNRAGHQSAHGTDLPDIESEKMVQLPPRINHPDMAAAGSDNKPADEPRPQKTANESGQNRASSSRPRLTVRQPTGSSDLLEAPSRPSFVSQDSDDSFVAFPLSQSQPTSGPDAESQKKLMDMVAENLKSQNLPQLVADSATGPNDDAGDASATDGGKSEIQKTAGDDAASDAGSSSPIGVPMRPKSRTDMSIDMQALVMNNQESFTSDADTNPNGQVNDQEPTNPDALTQVDGTTTARLEAKVAPPKGPTRRSSGFDPRFGAFMSSADHSPDYDNEEFIIDDFLRHDSKQSQAGNPLFTLTTMINELIKYHTTNLSDAQSLSALLLLLIPLLPESTPLDRLATQAVLSHYIEHLSSLQISEASIAAILSKTPTNLMLAGLNPLQIESILQTYHDQLQSLSLPVNAALLRRLCFPQFPSVYDIALKENTVHFRCGNCARPLPGCPSITKCPACGSRPVQCPVCLVPESPFAPARQKRGAPLLQPGSAPDPPPPGPAPTLFTVCLRCNHAVHAACANEWHALGDGGCPVAGCGCACVAPERRDEGGAKRQVLLRAGGSRGSRGSGSGGSGARS